MRWGRVRVHLEEEGRDSLGYPSLSMSQDSSVAEQSFHPPAKAMLE